MADPAAASAANGQVAKPEGAPGPPADAGAVQQQGPPPRQPTGMESFFAITKSLIVRAVIIYFITSFFRRPAAPPTNSTGPAAPSITATNIFADNTPLTLHVYLSESPELTNFSPQNLFWYKDSLTYADWTSGHYQDGTYVMEKKVPLTETLQNNGSLYLHAFVTKRGESPDPKAGNYAKNHLTRMSKQLNKFTKLKNSGTKNLLTGTSEQVEVEDGEIMSHWHPNFTINLVTDQTAWVYGSVPSPLDHFIKFKKLKNSGTKNLLTGTSEQIEVEDGKIVSHWHPNFTINLVTDQTAWVYGSVPSPLDQFIKFTSNGKQYKPVLFANDFWNMARDYRPVNDTTQELTLRVLYQPLSLFKWQLYAAQSMRQMWNVWGSGGEKEGQESDDEQDTLKETLMDTNPYLLGITICVSIFHSVFELLAFKNDIEFWNNRNSLEGLSVRSVFFSVFQSLVVLLYVLDNETNTLVRISCFVGLLIELWKIYKVVDIKFENGRLTFKDKGSYVDSSTKQYDNLAFKYLSWVCFPLLVGYSGYALFYLEHKGWYSFVLDLLYGYLLTFGFIMMTPQLFINYKLKSVAHLPWRMLTYKFVNTFIDDLFAFVIKMPTMYRLGCFRDDIVFLIFLYQRWIYPVDKTRRNEFGYSGETADQVGSGGGAVAITATSAAATPSGDEKTQQQQLPQEVKDEARQEVQEAKEEESKKTK